MLRRRDESLDSDELLQGIAQAVMRVDAKLDRVITLLEDEDGEAEEDS
jgi:hypothetical protein